MKAVLFALLLMASFMQSQRESGVVTGRLLSAEGKPAAGVRVMAVATDAPEALSAITETDATGAYRLENLAPGRYRIRAGLVESPTDYPGEITVTRGSVQTGVDFTLVRSAGVKLSGRVILDPRQKPLPQLRRVSLARGAPFVAEVQTDETGAFEFQRVPPGTYSVVMRGAAVINRSEVRGIQVGDKDITGIPVRVPLLDEVTVRMVVERNGPLPARPVNVTFVNGYGALAGQIQLIGETPVKLLFPENTYRATATDVPEGYSLTSIMRGSLDLTKEQLKLPSGDTSDVVVALRLQR